MTLRDHTCSGAVPVQDQDNASPRSRDSTAVPTSLLVPVHHDLCHMSLLPVDAYNRTTVLSDVRAIASGQQHRLLDKDRQTRGLPQNILKVNIRAVFQRLGEVECTFMHMDRRRAIVFFAHA